jgi:hypothetical protein
LYIPEPTPVATTTTPATRTRKGAAARKTTARHTTPKSKAPQYVAVQVNDMAFGNDAWFAGTTGGILVSKDHGTTWKNAGSDSLVKEPATSLETSLDGTQIWAISRHSLIYSADGGAHWDSKVLSFAVAGNLRVHRVDDLNLFITTDMGLYTSHDGGRNWTRSDVRELQFQDVAGNGNAMVVALRRHGLLASFDSGKSWKRVDDPLADGYFPVVRVRRNGALVAASATEGLLSLEIDGHSASSGGGGTAMILAPDGPQKPKN